MAKNSGDRKPRDPEAGEQPAPAAKSEAEASPPSGKLPPREPLGMEFLARMGHELRTPLNAIIGFVRLVEEEQYSSEEERRDYLGNARASALSLLDLINNILDLAAFETGKLVLGSLPVNLSTLVEEVTRTLAPEAHAKGLEIDCLVDNRLRRNFMSDPVRLRQVLFNLVGNAVKFTPSGLVLIRAEMLDSGQTSCRVRFSVQDKGIGIAPEWRDRIFESFVQSSAPISGSLRGVGLGLAISKQIIEQMKGELGFESKLEQGSTFWFEVDQALPAPNDPIFSGQESARAKGPGLEGVHLMVLNPEADARAMYGEKLSSLGAEVRLAASPQEAFTHLDAQGRQGHPVQLVLVDDLLHTEGAVLFAESVRRKTAQFQPDLIYLSPTGVIADSQRLIEAGITAFLTKPLTTWQLEDALLGLIGRQEENGVPSTVLRVFDQRQQGDLPFDPRQVRLLVAEDNVVNQKLIHALLSKQGMKVKIVANGREAVEAVANESFDLVLMDIQMPEMDGLTATREIRRGEYAKDLPIIALTAESLTGDLERCIAAGMNDHLAKPIMPDILNRKLAHWLDPSQAHHSEAVEWWPNATFENLPVLDLEQMTAVQDYALMVNPGAFEEWVATFLETLAVQMEQMSAARESGNWEDVAETARQVQRAAGGFGAPRLNAMAREMGEHARNRSAMLVNELMPFLQRESENLAEELRRHYPATTSTDATPP